MTKGLENKTEKDRKRNRRMVKKLIKTTYFLARKKWAVKNNFQEVLRFVADVGDEDIALHLEHAPKNASYISTFTAEQILKVIGDYLNQRIVDDVVASGDFTILADESTDEGDRVQMSMFVRLIDIYTNKPVERFLGIVKLTTSKKAEELHNVIMNLLQSKEINSANIQFCGFDGTNAMSGERSSFTIHKLQKSSFGIMFSSFNSTILEVVGVGRTLWKIFKYSTTKQAIFEESQEIFELSPTKILKACTTRWLTHGESCARVISCYEPLIDTLDTVFVEKGDAEAKGIRDQLLESNIICMLLLLAEVLAPINNFSKFLQTGTLLYCSVSAKLERLLERLRNINDSLINHAAVGSNLLYFPKVTSFLEISCQRNDLGCNLRCRNLASENEPQELLTKFLTETGYPFIEDLVEDISEALSEKDTVLPAFKVFYPNQLDTNRVNLLETLCDHYGKEIVDVFENEERVAAAVVITQGVTAESEDFFLEFDDINISLTDAVKTEARKKLDKREIKQDGVYIYINKHKPSSCDIYSVMCKNGSADRFPQIMKLFKLSLLIPPSTSGVECGFSVMNLLVSPLSATLNENNVDRLMRICLDGPDKLSDHQLEQLVDNFRDAAPRRIVL